MGHGTPPSLTWRGGTSSIRERRRGGPGRGSRLSRSNRLQSLLTRRAPTKRRVRVAQQGIEDAPRLEGQRGTEVLTAAIGRVGNHIHGGSRLNRLGGLGFTTALGRPTSCKLTISTLVAGIHVSMPIAHAQVVTCMRLPHRFAAAAAANEFEHACKLQPASTHVPTRSVE